MIHRHTQQRASISGKNILAGMIFWVCLLASGVAWADITVKTDVRVKGDIVTVGDLFDGVPDSKAGRAVTAAPEIGHSLTLNRASLQSVARANGLDWTPQSPYAQTRIERASRQLGKEEIADALLRALPPTALPATGNVSVQLDNAGLALYAPEGGATTLDVLNPTYDANTRRFRALLRLTDAASRKTLSQTEIAGRVVTTVSVPVLSRPMRKGEVIQASDIGWIDIEMAQGAEQFLFDADAVIGKTPRRAVRPNIPLRGFDLVAPILIKRGSQVTMIYESGNLQLTAKGRALADGAEGDIIRVVNLSSSRSVDALVESADVVRIGAAPASGLKSQTQAQTQAQTQTQTQKAILP